MARKDNDWQEEEMATTMGWCTFMQPAKEVLKGCSKVAKTYQGKASFAWSRATHMSTSTA